MTVAFGAVGLAELFIEILECLIFAILTNTGKKTSMNGKR